MTLDFAMPNSLKNPPAVTNTPRSLQSVIKDAERPIYVGESLHSLKGSTATVSVAAFHELAVVAETFARQGDIESLRSMTPNLCRESVLCLAFITEIKSAL